MCTRGVTSFNYGTVRRCGVYISVCVHLWDMAGCLEHGCRVSMGKNFILTVTTVNDVTTITICFYALFDVSSTECIYQSK